MLKIVGLFVAAAVAFGLVHDQITARVCIEYFTIAHPTLVRSESPTLLGLVWGVVATWSAGALVGVLVSLAAREGPWPKRSWQQLTTPARNLAFAMAAAALVAGVTGYSLTAGGIVPIVAAYQDVIAPDRAARFMADVYAHLASYIVGLLGGFTIAVQIVRSRRRESDL